MLHHEDREYISFSPGPALLPTDILKQLQKDIIEYEKTGLGLLELPKDSEEIKKIETNLRADTRKFYCIPDEFEILFMTGGSQFFNTVLAHNLLDEINTGDYLQSGVWSMKTITETLRFNDINIVSKLEDKVKPMKLDDPIEWKFGEKSTRFFYYCDNESAHGIEFTEPPESNHKLLIADLTSNIFSKPINWSRHALVFASSQKNFGIVGMVIVIIRKDVLASWKDNLPNHVSLKAQAVDSTRVLPPIMPLRTAQLIMQLFLKFGNVEAMDKACKDRSNILYEVIDNSNGFYKGCVAEHVRSRINITFNIKDADANLEAKLIKKWEENHMFQLKGFGNVGGLRASWYNAMPISAVERLAKVMREFQKEHS